MTVQTFPERHDAEPEYGYDPDQDYHRDPEQIRVPKPIVYGMIALVLLAIGLSVLGKVTQIGTTREAVLHPLRIVSFTVTGSDGGAIVATRSDGLVVQLAGANQNIFPRLIIHTMAVQRKFDGVPLTKPLHLLLMRSGQRLLVDPVTHETMRLAAFGSGNGHVLDALLAPKLSPHA